MRKRWLVLLLPILFMGGCETTEKVDNPQFDESKVNEQEMTDEQIKNAQYRIDENEQYLVDSNNPYTDTKVYAQSVISCEGHCNSKYMTYDEATELADRAKEIGGWDGDSVYRDWWENNGNKVVNGGITTTDNSGISSSSKLYNNGTCKEVESKYTPIGLKVTSCSYSSSKEKISITVENNSDFDLSYLQVEIYGIDSNGKTVSSDYTNHGSIIRKGASQTLEAYVDKYTSYEVEISKVTTK